MKSCFIVGCIGPVSWQYALRLTFRLILLRALTSALFLYLDSKHRYDDMDRGDDDGLAYGSFPNDLGSVRASSLTFQLVLGSITKKEPLRVSQSGLEDTFSR